MERIAAGLALLCAVLIPVSSYIVTCPREIRPGMSFSVNVAIETTAGATFSVELKDSMRTNLAWTGSRVDITIPPGQRTGTAVISNVPEELIPDAIYYVIVREGGSTARATEGEVKVYVPPSHIFIQTDKATYKPGDTVKYRILNTKPGLTPLSADIKAQIKDTLGNDIVVQTWDQQKLVAGEFVLSNDPIFGTFQIYVEAGPTAYKYAMFEVQEYVLPRFEVKLEMYEPYVLRSTGTIRGKVHAIYTNEEMVHGEMVLKVNGVVEKVFPMFDGSELFSIAVNSTMAAGKLEVLALMTEQHTGNTANASATVTSVDSPFKATVVTPIPHTAVGAEYNFQVELTDPMGGSLSAALRARSYRVRYTADYTVYTSAGQTTDQLSGYMDDVRVADLTLTPLAKWERPLLTAIVVYFEDMDSGEKCIESRIIPRKYAASNEGSMLQIYLDAAASTQEKACVAITATSSGTVDEDNIFFQVVDTFGPGPMKHYSTDQCVTITKAFAPKARIVAYYTTTSEGEEILAASADLLTRWTSDLTVSLDIVPSTAKPGETVDIFIQLTPPTAALVGIAGVDKSTTFLADGNDITKQKLQESFEQIRLFDRPTDNKHEPPFPIMRGGMMGGMNPLLDRRRRCTFVSAVEIVKDAGLRVITDASYDCIDGGWSSWGEWDDCTATCDKGTHTRTRTCDNPAPFNGGATCPGSSKDTQGCTVTPCPDNGQSWLNFVRPAMAMSPGIPSIDDRNDAMVDGGWSSWGEWDDCTATCGYSTHTRTRTCDNPAPLNGGATCPGSSKDTQDCTVTPCPGGAQDDSADSNQLDGNGSTDEEELPRASVRTDFPETWLWQIEATDYIAVPDTITNWVVNAFAVSDTLGLGVADTQEVTATQELFVAMDLPYSIVRGEQFDLKIVVFNYKSTAMQVIITLEPKPEEFMIDGSSLTNVEIPSGQSRMLPVGIRPKKAGEIILTATARSGVISDQEQRTLIVKPEGREETQSKELTVVVGTNRDFDLKSLIIVDPIVDDSLRMYMLVTGDIMGPFVQNLEGRIRVPSGCGEQNMITLVPSVYVAKYLVSIGRFGAEVKQKVQKYAGIGYRKELNYRHTKSPDTGGYSAFGQSSNTCGCDRPDADDGPHASTWLTAFVLSVFSVMSKQDITFVSGDMLKSSATFLCNQQAANPVTAYSYFGEPGRVIHAEMQGGAGSPGVALSANVLAALVDYTDATLDPDFEDCIEGAEAWLKGRAGALEKPYGLAIVAYALSRSGDTATATQLLDKFEANFTGYGTSDTQTGCPNCDVMRGYHHSGPTTVETLGYLLQAYIYVGNAAKAAEKKDILLDKRKAGGSFSSTQDTAVGLRALAEYSIAYPGQTADFTVGLTDAGGLTVAESVSMDADNYYALIEREIDMGYSGNMNVNVDVSGSAGVATVTLLAYYNTLSDVTVLQLDLDVTVTKTQEGTTVVSACFNVNTVENESAPGMVLVGVSEPSGMKYDRESMHEIVAQKVEYNDEEHRVYIYFDPPADADTQICSRVPMKTEYAVTNLQPANVFVQNYYAPENKVDRLYMAAEECTDCGPTTGASTTHMKAAEECTDCPTTGASTSHVNALLLGLAFALALLHQALARQ